MRILAVALAFVLLAACSSNTTSVWRSPSTIKNAYVQLEGQHLDVAIKKMGLPMAQQKIAGRTIFVWSDSDTVSTLNAQPIVNPVSGQVNWFAVSGNRSFHCTVKAVTNDAYIISKVEVKASSVYYCPGNSRR